MLFHAERGVANHLIDLYPSLYLEGYCLWYQGIEPPRPPVCASSYHGQSNIITGIHTHTLPPTVADLAEYLDRGSSKSNFHGDVARIS